MHQLANQVFDVPADVASLAELGRVGFYKRHFDKLGNVLDEIRFSDTGRPDQDYVLLDVFGFFRAPRVPPPPPPPTLPPPLIPPNPPPPPLPPLPPPPPHSPHLPLPP